MSLSAQHSQSQYWHSVQGSNGSVPCWSPSQNPLLYLPTEWLQVFIIHCGYSSPLPLARGTIYPVTERNVKRQSLSHVHCSEPRTCVLAGLWCCVCAYLLTVNSLANLLFCSDISSGKLSAFFPHLAQPRCSQHNLIRLCQIYFLKPRYLWYW